MQQDDSAFHVSLTLVHLLCTQPIPSAILCVRFSASLSVTRRYSRLRATRETNERTRTRSPWDYCHTRCVIHAELMDWSFSESTAQIYIPIYIHRVAEKSQL